MAEEGKIIRIREWTMLDELTNPVDAQRVSFTYADGTAAHVDIPNREFTQARVTASIAEKLAVWHALMGE